MAGRRPKGAAALKLLQEYNERAGVSIETDNVRITDPAAELGDTAPADADPEEEGWSRF